MDAAHNEKRLSEFSVSGSLSAVSGVSEATVEVFSASNQ